LPLELHASLRVIPASLWKRQDSRPSRILRPS
jgi:hypothetical protein